MVDRFAWSRLSLNLRELKKEKEMRSGSAVRLALSLLCALWPQLALASPRTYLPSRLSGCIISGVTFLRVFRLVFPRSEIVRRFVFLSHASARFSYLCDFLLILLLTLFVLLEIITCSEFGCCLRQLPLAARSVSLYSNQDGMDLFAHLLVLCFFVQEAPHFTRCTGASMRLTCVWQFKEIPLAI